LWTNFASQADGTLRTGSTSVTLGGQQLPVDRICGRIEVTRSGSYISQGNVGGTAKLRSVVLAVRIYNIPCAFPGKTLGAGITLVAFVALRSGCASCASCTGCASQADRTLGTDFASQTDKSLRTDCASQAGVAFQTLSAINTGRTLWTGCSRQTDDAGKLGTVTDEGSSLDVATYFQFFGGDCGTNTDVPFTGNT
jgi:hypothetical protein